MRSERPVCVGACLFVQRVRYLECVSTGSSIVRTCKCDNNRLIERNGVLKELEGGRVREAALVIRLPFGAQHKGAYTRELWWAVHANPFALLYSLPSTVPVDGSSGASRVDAWQRRAGRGAAPARQACGFEMSPRVVPDVL